MESKHKMGNFISNLIFLTVKTTGKNIYRYVYGFSQTTYLVSIPTNPLYIILLL